MLPDRESNPGPLTYESGALPIALRGPATEFVNIVDPDEVAHCHLIWVYHVCPFTFST